MHEDVGTMASGGTMTVPGGSLTTLFAGVDPLEGAVAAALPTQHRVAAARIVLRKAVYDLAGREIAALRAGQKWQGRLANGARAATGNYYVVDLDKTGRATGTTSMVAIR